MTSDSTLLSCPIPAVILLEPEPELLAAIERGITALGEPPAVKAAGLAEAANVIAEWRPFAVIVPADVFASDAVEFRALARDVGAEVITYDAHSGTRDVAGLLLPELQSAFDRWAKRETGTADRQSGR